MDKNKKIPIEDKMNYKELIKKLEKEVGVSFFLGNKIISDISFTANSYKHLLISNEKRYDETQHTGLKRWIERDIKFIEKLYTEYYKNELYL